MRRYCIYPIMVLCLSGIVVSGQSWYTVSDLTPYEELSGDIALSPDGGFVVVGTSEETPGSNLGVKDIVVKKLNADGEIQWNTTLDYDDVFGIQPDIAPRVVVLDNGTLIIGSTTYRDARVFLVIWRLTPSGELLERRILSAMVLHDMIKTSEGVVAVGTLYDYYSFPIRIVSAALYLDSAGMYISSHYGSWGLPEGEVQPYSIVEMSTGDHVVLSGTYHGLGYYSAYILDIVPPEGYSMGSHVLDTFLHSTIPGSIVSTDDGHVVVAYVVDQECHMRKIEPYTHELLWSTVIGIQIHNPVLSATSDGGFILACVTENGIELNKLDSAGMVEWRKEYPIPVSGIPDSDPPLGSILETQDGGFVLTGHVPDIVEGDRRLFVLRTDDQGNFGGILTGFVREDQDGDCIADSTEQPLKNWIIEAKSSDLALYTTTDSNGLYSLRIPEGDYMMDVLHPGRVLRSLCDSAHVISMTQSLDTIVLQRAVQNALDCALLDVDISINLLRRCQENVYKLQYCNFGTVSAIDATLTVDLSPGMHVLSAGLPFTTSGSTLLFNPGTIEPDYCAQFDIVVFLDCAASITEDHCVRASVSPIDFCIAGQPPAGFDFQDKDCRQVVMAVDPNDKLATPVGMGPDHLIPKDTTLEYMIRFQNTGNDTAFQVIIRDTLSQRLDPATLVPGAGSHPYTWHLAGTGVLVVEFPGILLPDSNANEALSHGFVSFRIRPKSTVLPNELIENTAAIYFDFNAPVITNTATHTIEKPVYYDSIEVSICQGEYYRDHEILSDTVVIDTIVGPLLDSILTVIIDMLPAEDFVEYVAVCGDETFTFYGVEYSEAGTYVQEHYTIDGCIIYATLELQIYPWLHSEEFLEACVGDTSDLFGTVYMLPGLHLEQITLQSSYGCDSFHIVNVEVHPNEMFNLYTTVMPGDLYLGHEIWQDTVFTILDTTAHGCQRTILQHVYVQTTANEEITDHPGLEVYPNPFSEYFEIIVYLSKPESVNVWVSDMLGRRVKTLWDDQSLPEGTHALSIETSEWTAGPYLLCVENSRGSVVRRLIRF